MADNKKQRGKADRAKVARFEGYEVTYFATKHNITLAKARALIERIGNDRNKLNAAAAKLKKGRGMRNKARPAALSSSIRS
jgi:hypothetical protein